MSPSRQEQCAGKRILIACMGNIFLGDDGFGVEVARQLERRGMRYPDGVQVIDFGIRGLDLAFKLLETYDTLVLVDVVQRGGQPGTLYLIEPDLKGIDACAECITSDTHNLDPYKVLAFARGLGAYPMETLLVACEPARPTSEPTDIEAQGLSKPVQAAIPGAIHMLDILVAHFCTDTPA